MTEPNWHKVPEEEFERRRRKALERKRGIHGRDPLESKRNAIADGATRIFYPRSKPCPVNPGDMFTVRGREIAIRKVKEDHRDGEEVWAVTIERLPKLDAPRLMRASLPADPPEREELVDGQVPPPRPGEEGEAAEDSAYTPSIAKSLDPEAGEAVPRDWEDQGKEAREMERQRARREADAVGETVERVRRIKSRLNQVGVWVARQGVEPDPALDRIEAEIDALEARGRELADAA